MKGMQRLQKLLEKINKPKMIDLTEFMNQGFLQEVNRLFFHPLGLALSTTMDENKKITGINGIWDYRNDPEGILFDHKSTPYKERKRKAENVKKLKESKLKKRLETKECGDDGIQKLELIKK